MGLWFLWVPVGSPQLSYQSNSLILRFYISTTIQTPEGKVLPLTVYPHGRLDGVDNGWFNSWVILILFVSPEGMRDCYQEFYRPSYFSWKQDLIWLFCHQIIRENFLMKSVQ